jgi:hypothetical protein
MNSSFNLGFVFCFFLQGLRWKSKEPTLRSSPLNDYKKCQCRASLFPFLFINYNPFLFGFTVCGSNYRLSCVFSLLYAVDFQHIMRRLLKTYCLFYYYYYYYYYCLLPHFGGCSICLIADFIIKLNSLLNTEGQPSDFYIHSSSHKLLYET